MAEWKDRWMMEEREEGCMHCGFSIVSIVWRGNGCKKEKKEVLIVLTDIDPNSAKYIVCVGSDTTFSSVNGAQDLDTNHKKTFTVYVSYQSCISHSLHHPLKDIFSVQIMIPRQWKGFSSVRNFHIIHHILYTKDKRSLSLSHSSSLGILSFSLWYMSLFQTRTHTVSLRLLMWSQASHCRPCRYTKYFFFFLLLSDSSLHLPRYFCDCMYVYCLPRMRTSLPRAKPKFKSSISTNCGQIFRNRATDMHKTKILI